MLVFVSVRHALWKGGGGGVSFIMIDLVVVLIVDYLNNLLSTTPVCNFPSH